MLKLQGQCAHLQNQIDQDQLQVLTIAIDAQTPEAWQANGNRIVLLPAYLSAGGKDTPNEGPTTLSGVTFIEEQVSGMTLLYLPDSPDGQCLRRYDSLESRAPGLVQSVPAQRNGQLPGRASLERQRGGPRKPHQPGHVETFRRHDRRWPGWPSTTSLAEHLLNAHMGRLIEAHRDTSRSARSCTWNATPQRRESVQLHQDGDGPGALRRAGVALYDAWSSANNAVAALSHGEVAEGLAEVESVLVSLIDAAMDIAGTSPATRLDHRRPLAGACSSVDGAGQRRPALRSTQHATHDISPTLRRIRV